MTGYLSSHTESSFHENGSQFSIRPSQSVATDGTLVDAGKMALASWLLAPIRAPRALPLLPGAIDDAMTREGTATCAPSAATTGAKRKSPPASPAGVNPFSIASRAASAPCTSSRRGADANPETLPRGDYHLPNHPSSLLRYEPAAMSCTRDEYEQLWRFADSVAPTPNPMNKRVNLLRKQATFGATYRFGAQVRERVDLPSRDTWPALVRRCVEDAVERTSDGKRDAYRSGIAAHVNWYPDGRAGMGRHRDAEPDLVPGAPIFSYSFSSASARGLPRIFDVYRLGAKRPIAAVPLSHGDVLVMAGTMQETHEHGVRGTARRAYAGESRINVTVRAFKPGSLAVRVEKSANNT